MTVAAALVMAVAHLQHNDEARTAEIATHEVVVNDKNNELQGSNVAISTLTKPEVLSPEDTSNEKEKTLIIDVVGKDTPNTQEEENTYDREYALVDILTKLGTYQSNDVISEEDIAVLGSLNTQDLDYDYIKTYIDNSLF